MVMEDESGWDCTTMGNQVCGPENVQGVPAGVYDAGGVLVDVGEWGSVSSIHPA